MPGNGLLLHRRPDENASIKENAVWIRRCISTRSSLPSLCQPNCKWVPDSKRSVTSDSSLHASSTTIEALFKAIVTVVCVISIGIEKRKCNHYSMSFKHVMKRKGPKQDSCRTSWLSQVWNEHHSEDRFFIFLFIFISIFNFYYYYYYHFLFAW